MPGPAAGRDGDVPLAYRRYAVAAGSSPLQARVARAVSESGPALRAIEAMPARRRQPAVILAALHDLALAGAAPALAAAYAAPDPDAAADAAVSVLLAMTDAVTGAAGRRPVRSDETTRGAVLYPAIAEAARRAGAAAVGLVDVGCSAGLNLIVDRLAIGYGDGPPLGDPASPVRRAASVVGARPVPGQPVPPVVARIGLDRDPFDVTDADDRRWLHACLPPDQPERAARLEAELALAAACRPVLLRGDLVDAVAEAVARVPPGALPVVTTTWALSRVRPGRRPRFLDRLRQAAAGRTVAWVSAEGVGVAPGIPTLGDRPASGHSIIGLALLTGADTRAVALGRCWSRGRLLAWLADPEPGDGGAAPAASGTAGPGRAGSGTAGAGAR